MNTLPNYNTNDKSKWGPHYWFVMHSFAESYSDSPSEFEVLIARRFIELIPLILPCTECAEHALKYIKNVYHKMDYITSSKQNLIAFFKLFHDDVNERLGKPRLFS